MAPKASAAAQSSDTVTPVAQREGFQEYPKAKYHTCDPSSKHPNGYVVRRVNNADEEKALGLAWKDSPANL